MGSTLRMWVRQTAWPLVLLLIGLWLVLGGKRLMRLAYGHVSVGSGATQPLTWKPRVLFSVALRVFGVVLLTLRLPWLIGSLVMQAFPLAVEARKNWFGTDPSFDWEKFLGGLLILAIAVYLISGAKHLVTFIFRKREPDSPAAG